MAKPGEYEQQLDEAAEILGEEFGLRVGRLCVADGCRQIIAELNHLRKRIKPPSPYDPEAQP